MPLRLILEVVVEIHLDISWALEQRLSFLITIAIVLCLILLTKFEVVWLGKLVRNN